MHSSLDVTEILLDHFTNIHKKSTRGVVTIIPVRSDDADLWPALPPNGNSPMRIEPWNGLAAGIGKVGFLFLKIDEISLEILARMPIMPTKKTEYESTRTAYCISVPKHYGKIAVRRRELRSGIVPGRQLHDTPLSWGSIKFETAHPESIIKAEFYIAKILGAIRRKVKLHRGCSYVGSRGKDIVFLKDVFDCTDLIAFATGEWEKHKSKQRRRNK